MVSRRGVLAGIFLSILVSAPLVYAAAPQLVEATIQLIGPSKPTSFPGLLFVQITNPGYAPVNLGQLLSGASLIIDGKPSARVTTPFRGPQGLPPMGEWEGCLSVASFTPPITPGKHKISLKIGSVQTSEIKVSWQEPLNWKQGNLKSRFKEIQLLGLVVDDGLPQECVEQWLTVKDGGPQEEDKVRYYLAPQYKMTVPYRQMYQPSGLRAVVDGPPTIYQEQRLND